MSTDGRPDSETDADPLLSVRGLKKHFPITEGLRQREVGRVRAVDGISFDLYPGETLGLIGESGCGKSTAARSLLRLDEPTEGSVVVDGQDITDYDRKTLRQFRRHAQMIFQDPTASFDPRMTVGEAIAEPLVAQGVRDRSVRRDRVEALLARVGLSASDADRYPHELSGGQKQRAGLSRALSVNPDLLVADEPVSALDVSVQAEILDLLDDLQEEFGLSVLFITHDMGVVRDICDRVAVMYLGELVEKGPTERVFRSPEHPYTRALVSSIPDPMPGGESRRVPLSGDVPDPANPPSGCRFHTRCPAVIVPESLDLDQQTYRAVLDLRVHLDEETIDFDSLAELAGDADEATDVVSDRALRRTVRDEHDLPETLADDDADAALSSALESAVAGDTDAALETLASTFETVCERHAPALTDVEDGHLAACHLHDDDFQRTETPVAADD